jgi:excisionase family DNA binding protein
VAREIVEVLEELVVVMKDVRRELRRDVLSKDFYTVGEAAKIAKASDYTIRRWIKSGKLAAEKLFDGDKARYRITKQALAKLLGQ